MTSTSPAVLSTPLHRSCWSPVKLFALVYCVCATLVATAAGAQTNAYVVNSAAGTVSVIDTAGRLVIGAIPVGLAPRHVVVTPDGTRAYVSNGGSDSVSVIDTASNTVVATIAVGDDPSTLAVSPDGERLYVTVAGGLVQAIETIGNSVLATIPVGAGGEMAVTPDGARVYVAAGLIHVLDTATNTVVSSFPAELNPAAPAGNSALGIAIRPDGRAYVTVITGLFSGGLVVVDTGSDSVIGSIGLGSIPGPIAMAPDGSRAYVAVDATWVDTGYGAGFFPGRTVQVLDTTTDVLAGMIDLGADGSNWTQQNTAKAVAVSPDRSAVYMSVPRIGTVAIADVNTNLVTTWISLAGPGRIGMRPGGSELTPYAIIAADDSATASSAGGTAIASVLANDRIGGVAVALAHVRLTLQASSSPGVTLNAANGSVLVAAGTPIGAHTLVYRICEIASSSNCDDATVTVTVRTPYVINAVNDSATSNTGRTALASVVANDTLNGAAATLSTVALFQLSSTSAGITLSPGNGSVFVAAGTSIGTHTLVYRICEIESPVNCDDATVTVAVIPFAIDAVDDNATGPRTGGVVLANVLANDAFAGATATLAKVGLAQISATSSGIALDVTSGAVSVAAGTVAGTHTLVYRICETANASNCDQANVTITVQPYVVDAADDYAKVSSKRAGTALPSVLANDRFAGGPATTANVKLSRVSLTPANNKIRLDLTDGSVDVLGKTRSGTYLLVYRICELASPANCDQATVTLDLSGGL